MFRFVCVLMLAGLFVALGCERKPADRTPGKVTPEDVRRDAGKAVNTAVEYSQQTKEELQKKLDAPVADRTAEKVTPEAVRQDVGKAIEKDSEYAKQLKKEFQNKLDAQLNALDGEIIKLREKGRNLKDTAKANWDQKMAELDTKMDAARAKLEKLGHASEDAWKDIREGTQRAYDDLNKAFRDASKD